MRHSRRMSVAFTPEDVGIMTLGVPISCMVIPSASPAAEALEQGLRAAGMKVTLLGNAYDAVVEIEQRGGGFRHLVLGVDFFGRDELQIIPVVRREWPETTIVAYHSPGFEHKGRLAELVGADLVLGTPEAISQFVEGLAPSEPAAAATTAEAPAAIVEAPAAHREPRESAGQPAAEEPVEVAAAPSPVFDKPPAKMTYGPPADYGKVPPRGIPAMSDTSHAAAFIAGAPTNSSTGRPPSALESVEVQRVLASAGRPVGAREPAGKPPEEKKPPVAAPEPARPTAAEMMQAGRVARDEGSSRIVRSAMEEGAAELLDNGGMANSRDLSRIELTEEELGMLLGEDGDEDHSRGQP
jgi:hypothetical protein